MVAVGCHGDDKTWSCQHNSSAGCHRLAVTSAACAIQCSFTTLVCCDLVCAAQTGLQEKATFLQAFGKKGVYSSFIRLPAIAEVLLLATVLLVLWQYAAPAASSTRRQQVEYSPVQVDVHV